MDEKVEVETPFGPIWLRGRDTGRPAVVLIHGAFSAPEPVARVRADGLDFFVAHLPGNHCPDLSATNIGVWGAAYRYAVEHGLGGRDHVVVGVSTGALIALAMRSRGLRQLVLAEPPLWPAEIWPLRSFPGETRPGATRCCGRCSASATGVSSLATTAI